MEQEDLQLFGNLKQCTITLSEDDVETLIQSLYEDSEPNEKLQEAVQKYLDKKE